MQSGVYDEFSAKFVEAVRALKCATSLATTGIAASVPKFSVVDPKLAEADGRVSGVSFSPAPLASGIPKLLTPNGTRSGGDPHDAAAARCVDRSFCSLSNGTLEVLKPMARYPKHSYS